MAIAWTSEYPNINTATFTDVSAPVDTDDLWNPLAASAFDGVDDYKTSSELPLSASSGTSHTVQFWLKYTTSSSGFDFLLGQYNNASATNRTLLVNVNSTDQLTVQFFTNGSNSVTSIIADGHKNWNDGNWHMITGVTSGSSPAIYIDGVVASAYVSQTSAGSYTGPGSDPDTLSIGATEDGGALTLGTITRLKVAEGDAATAGEVTAEYSSEVAAQGEGFGAAAPTIGGQGRPSFRLDILRQTRYNRGLPRFNR